MTKQFPMLHRWLVDDALEVKTSSFNPFPNKSLFLRVCSTSLLKTLWEKERLLETSNFSFSHSVFYPVITLSAVFIKFKIVVCKHFQFGRVQNLSSGKGLKRELYFRSMFYMINYMISLKNRIVFWDLLTTDWKHKFRFCHQNLSSCVHTN